VIVLDANILIYSYDIGWSRHAKARAWAEETFSGSETVGLSWQAVCAFLRLMTNRWLPGSRFSLEQAAQIVDGWLRLPNVGILVPGEQHWSLLRRMVIEGQASGSLVRDAEIAALTIEYGGVLCTADRDFARFPGLRWKNPLE
jgi:toxin-antitoxin system PIN domain toxin